MKNTTLAALLASAATAAMATVARADFVSISSSLVGGFDAGGGYSNTLAGQNYFTGTTATGPTMDRRTFFTFHLPAALPGPVTAAALVIRMPLLPSPGGMGGTPGYFSDDPFETFRISDTPFSAAAIAAPHTIAEALAIWATLGTGSLWGTYDVTPSLAGTDITIPLSASAVAYIVGHMGSDIVIGGQVSSLDGSSPDELIFAYSDIPSPHMVEPRLLLGFAPTPGALPVAGLVLACSARRPRRAR